MDDDTLKEQEKRVDKPMSKLLNYCKPYKRRLVIGVLSVIVASTFGLVPPYLVRTAIDEAIIPGNFGLLWMVVAALVGAYAGRAIFEYAQNFFLFTFAQEAIYHLRMDTYKHLQELSLSFHSNQPTGKMMSKLSNDINRLQRFLSSTMREIVRNITIGLVIGVVLFWMNWKLAFFTLVPIPIIGFMTYHFAGKIRPKWDAVRKSVGDVNSRLQNNIAGIETIKSFAREEYEIERVGDVSDDYRQTNVESIKLWSKFFPAVGFAVSVGAVIVIGYGGYLVIEEALTIGTLIAFNAYIWQFYEPMRMLGWVTNSHQRAAASAARVFGILQEPIGIKNQDNPEKVGEIEGEVEFEEVTFHYGDPEKEEEEDSALHEVSFKVKPGETVALVGPSGSGKTTTVNMILRFYDPDNGMVKIDGRDIRKLDVKELRDKIGIVSQDAFLFDDDVMTNISYGDPEATDEKIKEAANKAAAHDFIEDFKDGYETEVGEDGVKLSGGQKQRISIARTILNDPEILILDEATSDVDTITEVKIQDAINELIKDRTTIMIAHDLSTARLADRIICLEDGKVVEQGTHEELLEKDGLYKKLWDMQSSLNRP
ncbi:MAG: ABC transporter ATP-binding protein [Candidatus Aenigmatarchaeota archaeon]